MFRANGNLPAIDSCSFLDMTKSQKISNTKNTQTYFDYITNQYLLPPSLPTLQVTRMCFGSFQVKVNRLLSSCHYKKHLSAISRGQRLSINYFYTSCGKCMPFWIFFYIAEERNRIGIWGSCTKIFFCFRPNRYSRLASWLTRYFL